MKLDICESIQTEKKFIPSGDELKMQSEREGALRKGAVKILQNASNEALKKRFSELADKKKTFLNVKGKNPLNAEIFYMATVAGKNTIEDEFIVNELMEMERNGEEVTLVDAYKKKISSEISSADLHRLVFMAFVSNTIEKEISNLKKAFNNTELYQQKLREIGSEEMQALKEQIMLNLTRTSNVEKDFLELRSKNADAPLDVISQNEIEVLIHEEVGAELIIDEIPIKFNLAKSSVVGIAGAPATSPVNRQNIQKEKKASLSINNDSTGVKLTEKEKDYKNEVNDKDIISLSEDANKEKKDVENVFEIDISRKEVLEEELLRAFHLIEEIEGDELDIDFMPAEKHFSGNLRDRIGELLNESKLIDENPVGEGAEEYWKKLNTLRELGEEVIGLEKKNQICVTYEDNTFFINKRQEILAQDLEKVTADVVSEKYLKAFIFGIRSNYEKYVSALLENPKWLELTDSEKKNLKMNGIIFYANEILKENKKYPNADVREKIYKYAFTILNK